MRSGLDQNEASGLQLKSGKLGATRVALTGNLTVPVDGPIIYALDANGSDRTITLPDNQRGLFFVIGNVGAANKLTLSVGDVNPGQTVLLFSSPSEWLVLGRTFGPSGAGHFAGIVPDPTAISGSSKFLREDGTWSTPAGGGGGLSNAYATVSDGVNTSTASGADTLRVRSSTGKLTATVTNNDLTFGDNVDLTVNEAAIDHNSLLNFVSNKHIDHTSVSISTAANSGLAGGGDISATRTLTVDINNLTVDTPVLGDSFAFYDLSGGDTNKATLSGLNAIIDHNSLLNFVTNKHIDHSLVSITAGTALSGGGDITTSRTLNVDIHSLTEDTLASGDEFIFYDISGSDTNKITLANLNGSIDHDSLLNFVANKHIDHTTVSVTPPAEFTGGGTIAATRTWAWATQSANFVLAGPTSGIAAAPTFRALVGADLPNPSSSTLGGIQSIATVAHQWVASISTSGVPSLTQPAESDLSFTDITTNNASTTKHGFVPKLPNVAAQFLDGTGAWRVLATSDLPSNPTLATITFIIDGGGATITTGLKAYLEIPFGCTINRATLLADQSGSIVVDIFKCTYANFDVSTHPVAADKITASAPPTITTAVKAQDSTLTGWTTAITAGDILAVNVNSITTCQRVTLSLKVTKT